MGSLWTLGHFKTAASERNSHDFPMVCLPGLFGKGNFLTGKYGVYKGSKLGILGIFKKMAGENVRNDSVLF